MEPGILIDKIISEQLPAIFFSPHLDDAVLSCGDLIYYLSDKTKVVVVTVFTEASSMPYSLSCKSALRQTGFSDGESYFKQRKLEDIETLRNIGVEAVHLGYTDALWRKKKHPDVISRLAGSFIPEANYIYPIYKIHIAAGKIRDDSDFLNDVASALGKIATRNERAEFFAPMGIGNHVDHLIVRDISLRNFPQAVFWADFPYNLSASQPLEFQTRVNFVWEKQPEKKLELIQGYKTQVPGLFHNQQIPLRAESYRSLKL